jgi:hypothetical protein
MRFMFVPAALLSLAACSQPAEQQPAAANETLSETVQAAVPSLEGEWVVELANGKALDQMWPMTASATKDRFTIASDCRRMSWTFKQDRNFVQFTPAGGAECGRVRSPAELLADSSVKLAQTVIFEDEGSSAQISGSGGTLSMKRR